MLSIYPFSRGFAFVFFEGSESPFDWGVKEVKEKHKNTKTLDEIRKLMIDTVPRYWSSRIRATKHRAAIRAYGSCTGCSCTWRRLNMSMFAGIRKPKSESASRQSVPLPNTRSPRRLQPRSQPFVTEYRPSGRPGQARTRDRACLTRRRSGLPTFLDRLEAHTLTMFLHDENASLLLRSTESPVLLTWQGGNHGNRWVLARNPTYTLG